MAGGSGERFWPMSRITRPKQLLNLVSPDQTLLEMTLSRLDGIVDLDDVIVATAPHLVEPSKQATPGLEAKHFLAEPHKKNTAGCLVWVAASLLAQGNAENVSMGVLAADHLISPPAEFKRTIEQCFRVAEEMQTIVTIGIQPDRPETGYGYIEVETASENVGANGVNIQKVNRFCEKPDRETAERFLADGNFLWNSGTFFWTLKTFLSELESASPEHHRAILQIADCLQNGKDAQAAEIFASLTSVSIDYALMEKTSNIHVASATFTWDDVGSWDSLDRAAKLAPGENFERGDTTVVESEGCVIVNESTSQTVTVLGGEDLIVVVTSDAVLVTPKSRAQEVRKVVDSLKAKGSTKI